MKPSRASGNATDKVLTVLQALPDHGRVSSLAAATGLPKSTVHRILQSLVEHRFALDLGGGRYAGGPRILTLAGKVTGQSLPAHQVDPVLKELQESTGFTVHLGMTAGDEAVYTAKVESKKPYRMPSRVGMSIALHTTAIGKAVLAAMSDGEILNYAGRTGLPARTPASITDSGALLTHLGEVRRAGHAIDDEENEAGIWCIGAAVRDHTGRTTGAVSISTLVHEREAISPERLAPRIAAAAEEISRAYGAPDPA